MSKQLEREIIDAIRIAIASFRTPGVHPSLAQDEMDLAHRIFANHLLAWSDDFAVLYQQMYSIWCAYTPRPTGQYHRKTIEIGWTPHEYSVWKNDKVQPPLPTAEELLARFDQLIAAYDANALEEIAR